MFWAQAILTITLTWAKNTKDIQRGCRIICSTSHQLKQIDVKSSSLHNASLFTVVHHHHWQDSWILETIAHLWAAEILKTPMHFSSTLSIAFLNFPTLCILWIFLPLCRGDSSYSLYLFLESSYVKCWLNAWGLSPRVSNCFSNAS